jgi:hypothetical protein
MATRDQLKEAILKADAAGDTESAQRFAEMYKAAPAGASAPAKRTFLGALAEGAGAAGPQAMRWMGNLDLNPANIPEHAMTLGTALAGLPGAAGGVAAGVAQQYRDLSPKQFQGSAPRMDTAPALAAENAVYQRYGAMPGPQRDKPRFNKQNVYNTIATDPIGTLSDVSTVLAMPEAMGMRGASKMGQIGEALAKTSQVLNPAMAPINGAILAGKLASKAEPLVSHGLGATTGTSATAVREAAKAGAAGGTRADAFEASMRGTADPLAVVEDAKAALGRMHQAKSASYRSDILPISNDPTVLSFSGIEKSVKDVENRGSYKGVAINEEASSAWQKINKKVEEWKRLDPAEYHTAEGLDALKKSIGDIQQSLPYGSPARSAADAVYASVKAEITKQAPAYGKVMSDYEDASQSLRDLERELSLGKKGNAGTAVRKLQAALRNNANTGWGAREGMARKLEDAGADTMFPALAGQAMSPVFPRGLGGAVVGGVEGAGALLAHGNPAILGSMLAAVPITSPRIVGEAALAAGKGSAAAKRIGQALANKAPALTRSNVNKATLLGQQLARPEKSGLVSSPATNNRS